MAELMSGRQQALERAADALWRESGAGPRGYSYDRLEPVTKDDLRRLANAVLVAAFGEFFEMTRHGADRLKREVESLKCEHDSRVSEKHAALARAEAAESDAARYRSALQRIASAESGVWGRIAHEALTGDS